MGADCDTLQDHEASAALPKWLPSLEVSFKLSNMLNHLVWKSIKADVP